MATTLQNVKFKHASTNLDDVSVESNSSHAAVDANDSDACILSGCWLYCNTSSYRYAVAADQCNDWLICGCIYVNSGANFSYGTGSEYGCITL